MNGKINWGILGCADIAVSKIMPAMLLGQKSIIHAVASRDIGKARQVAIRFNAPTAHGSYEAMLEDPDVQAVYIPLPNNLHVEWALRAIGAGKHVLCEKPFAMTSDDARKLVKASRAAGVKVGEAFMIKHHPQWIRAKEILSGGDLGEVRAITSVFSYFNDDPTNVRNIKRFGGGGLYDVGCYPIMAARMILGEEPLRVVAHADYDPDFGTDRVTTALVEFPSCVLSFLCGTQLTAFQHVSVLCTRKRLEFRLPFNSPPGKDPEISVIGDRKTFEEGERTSFGSVNHYTLQFDSFSDAILENREPVVPVENTLSMARIYEAAFRSLESKSWESIPG